MLHDTIRRIREEHKLTREEVAERLNLALRTYARIESGDTRLDWERIRSIAELYNMGPEELVSRDQSTMIFNGDNNGANQGQAFHCTIYSGQKELYDQLIAQLRGKNERLLQEVERMRADMAFLREELSRLRRGEG